MKKVEYSRDPSVLAFMTRALWPSPGFADLPPALEFTRTGFEFSEKLCRDLFELCGMPFSDELPVFFPQVLGFRLIMRAVTDPSFPEPIWNSLQVRNELTQYRSLRIGEKLDFRLTVKEQRFLEKGAEVDLLLTASDGGGTAWEGTTTFYYRGRFQKGKATTPRPPELKGALLTNFVLPSEGGFRFGRISGDFNGIHLFTPYAKVFGFNRAFLHPHRVAGAALAKIGPDQSKFPCRLDLWFRGPVPYGAKASLCREDDDGGVRFAIFAADTRPSLIGRLGR